MHSRSIRDAEVQRLMTLYQLVSALTKADSLDDIYESGLAALCEATMASGAGILLFDQDGLIRFQASRGISLDRHQVVTRHSPKAYGDRDLCAMVIPDVFADRNLSEYRKAFRTEGIRGVAFIPLALESEVFGKLMLSYSEPRECSGEELEIAEVIAAHIALATERKRVEIQPGRAYRSIEFPLQGPNGLTTGVCGIASDITEREELERSHQRLAAIVESSDDAIVSKDLNGIITSWNRGAEQIFGYTAAEAIGRPVSILAAPDTASEMPEILSKIRRGDRVDHYETRRRRKDGQIIDVALTVSPVRDASGRIVGASKIARDITDKRRAEEERKLLLAREQEARRIAELLNRVGPRLAAQLNLEQLVPEVTDIATAAVEAEVGAFFRKEAGDKCESYTAQAWSGVLRETVEQLSISEAMDRIGPALNTHEVIRCDDWTLDARYTAAADRGRFVLRSCLWVPVIARSNEILGGLFLGHSAAGKFTEAHEEILRGISAQASTAMDNARLFEQSQWSQAELKRSNDEFRRVNRDLEAFAYSASHDLQEPLRNIAISAQLLERRWDKRLENEDAILLRNVIKSSKRMKALIDDVLAYTIAARREEGAIPRVDARSALSDVLEGLQTSLDQAGAKITIGPLPVVPIHRSRLVQVFQNLISNAIKYRRSEPLHVRIQADEHDGCTVFSVADNGIGIEPQYAHQIFGLFKRLHGGEQYPGNGIGLAICQRVLETYGGRIWLEQSTAGVGSTFCFTIPQSNG